MNCKKVQALLVDFAEARADKRNYQRGSMRKTSTIFIAPMVQVRERLIWRHLRRCDGCRRELERIEKVRQELRKMRAPELTGDEWSTFQEKLSSKLVDIEQLPQLQHSRKPSLILVAVGAVFALLLLLVLTRQLIIEPLEKGPSLAKNQVRSALPEEQLGLKSTGESGEAVESNLAGMAGLSSEEINELVNDVASLSDDEWNELIDGMADGMIASWDIEDEMDALSLEERNEVLERLEST
jgi:hypothetical protein